MRKSVPPSLLSRIVINSPCHEEWASMHGDDRQRHCDRCRKNVFNLSEMTEAEALTLIGAGTPMCVRLYRRPDGSVLTKECGPSIRSRWLTRAALWSMLLAALATIGVRRATAQNSNNEPSEIPESSFTRGEASVPSDTKRIETMGKMVMGEMVAPRPTPTSTSEQK